MKKLLIIITCFFTVQTGFSQLTNERAKLEKERQDIQNEIQEIQSNYNKVKGLKKESLGKLAILQRKLELQDRLIGNINRDIHRLDDEIYLGNVELYRLQVQLDTLKAQYARSVVYAYKNNTSYDFLNFIFSANSFNDALNRISYLKSYRAYREEQVTAIKDRQKIIADKKQQMVAKQSEKKSVLKNQEVQLNELASQKKEKDAVVSKLKSQEKQLSKEIASKKKRDKQLQGQIAAIIRRIIDEERRKTVVATNPDINTKTNPKTTTKTTKEYFNLNEGERKLAANFEANKAKLPWPVDNGVVTIPFGSSVVGGLTIDNPGITISTPSAGGAVKAVFSGEVSAVSNLGDGMMVMVRHGKYFTIYSNLSSANVSKGSTVTTGQVIGRTGEADDGSGGQLDFMLMIENRNVNPQPWLHR
ncbi:MAG TPA: peptidoglycan DD-metalloendopeptidase family protein [Flavisolibacter sp.]|jgi:murein hydrolase activator|nr:peptidoglycan DD-metalloendopeptidase family protein [Flavisolibacter sp.]